MLTRPNRMRARITGVSAVILAGALSLSGCAGGSSGGGTSTASGSGCFLSGTNTSSGGGAASNGKVTISFMETMIGGAQKPALQHLTEEFEQANPNITVTLEGSPNYSTLQQNERNAVAAKKAPTIAQAYESWAADYARSGVIDPLDSYAGNSASSFYKGVRDDLKLCDGHTWMWPFGKSLSVLFYNQDMLKSAGQQVPATWDQFASTLKAVSHNGVTGISIDPGGPTDLSEGVIWFEILAAANGTPVFDKNGQPQFDSPAAIKAAQYLADLKKAGALATGTGYPGETALGGQKGVFDISSVAGYSYEAKAVGGKFTLGTANLPAGPAGNANQMNGANIVLFSQASPAEKQAAWKYMRFLASPSSQAYWATQTGYLPVTQGALSQMTSFTAQNPWMVTATNALNDATGSIPAPWGDKTQSELGVALSSILDDDANPSDALKKAQTSAVADVKASS